MPPKKPEEKKPGTDHFPSVVLFLFILAFLGLAVSRFQTFFRPGYFQSFWYNILAYLTLHIWPGIKFLAVVASIFSIIGIVIILRKLSILSKEEDKIYHSHGEEAAKNLLVEEKNEKWERVLAHANSVNPSDWRLAIIEADVMLDEVLQVSGYHGDGVGEMLKSVDRSDLLTLDAAWEAHKVRNEIAHAGGDYQLTEREARRVITLFESVFKELRII